MSGERYRSIFIGWHLVISWYSFDFIFVIWSCKDVYLCISAWHGQWSGLTFRVDGVITLQ